MGEVVLWEVGLQFLGRVGLQFLERVRSFDFCRNDRYLVGPSLFMGEVIL